MSKYLDPKKRAIVPKGKSGFSSQKRKGIITDHAYTAGLPQKAMKSEGLALSQLVTSPLLGLSVHLYKMGKWQVDPTVSLPHSLSLSVTLLLFLTLSFPPSQLISAQNSPNKSIWAPCCLQKPLPDGGMDLSQ